MIEERNISPNYPPLTNGEVTEAQAEVEELSNNIAEDTLLSPEEQALLDTVL